MKRSGNKTTERILSALILLPVYAWFGVTSRFESLPVLLLSLVVTVAITYEYFQIAQRDNGAKPMYITGITSVVVMNVTMYLFAYGRLYGYDRFFPAFDARIIMGIIALIIMVIMFFQVFTRPIMGGTYAIAVTVFGIVYGGLLFPHIIMMKALQNGIYYIILLHFIIMVNDTAAFFGGVLLGRHKTNFAVSPNKSWEGYFSGLLFSIIATILLNQFYLSFFGVELFSMIEAAIVGIALSIFGNVGDLVESAIKRDGGFKDSGSLIPGHGGMWDVFDSIVFSTPLFYYYLVISGVQ